LSVAAGPLPTGPANDLNNNEEKLARKSTHLNGSPPAFPDSASETTHRALPSWSMVVDLCLELQALREHLAAVDADHVEWVAQERLTFYHAIGGTSKSLASFRAETRLELAELRGGPVPPPPLDWDPDSHVAAVPPAAKRRGRRKVLGSC